VQLQHTPVQLPHTVVQQLSHTVVQLPHSVVQLPHTPVQLPHTPVQLPHVFCAATAHCCLGKPVDRYGAAVLDGSRATPGGLFLVLCCQLYLQGQG
jgi:hypothetical protein